MEKLDKDKLKKFHKIVKSLKRSVPTEGGLYGSNCEKSVFVGRWSYFNLGKKCFKIKIKNKIHYAVFAKSTEVSFRKESYKRHSGGFEYGLGWRDDYKLTFNNERLELIEISVSFNDLLHLEYEEISVEKYIEVVNLFTS